MQVGEIRSNQSDLIQNKVVEFNQTLLVII